MIPHEHHTTLNVCSNYVRFGFMTEWTCAFAVTCKQTRTHLCTLALIAGFITIYVVILTYCLQLQRKINCECWCVTCTVDEMVLYNNGSCPYTIKDLPQHSVQHMDTLQLCNTRFSSYVNRCTSTVMLLWTDVSVLLLLITDVSIKPGTAFPRSSLLTSKNSVK